MSTIARIGSGTIAAWSRLGVTALGQVLLVPILLSHWDATTFGLWISFQAIIALLTVADVAHHTFIGYELMKLGPARPGEFSKILWSSLPAALVLAVIGLAVIGVLSVSGGLKFLIGLKGEGHGDLVAMATAALLVQSGTWLVVGTLWGLLARAVVPFGYYAAAAWWGVAAAIVIVAAPAVAVACGANILGAMIATNVATSVLAVLQILSCIRILAFHGVQVSRPDLVLGFRHALLSLALAGRDFLNQARQQGIRLILAPIVGLGQIAAFATMRTGANLMLQGLGTITGPLEPELLRFIRDRDQDRLVAGFASVWFVVIGALAPGVVLVQVLMVDLFPIWTRGKVVFDPLLFAIFSASILVYAHAQPATTIVRGNNLLRAQLGMAVMATAVTLVGLVIAVPSFGIRGAAVVLFIAECASLVGFTTLAAGWLKRHNLRWPAAMSRLSSASIVATIVAILVVSHVPHQRWLLLAGSWAAQLALLVVFLGALPASIRDRGRQLILARMPPRIRTLLTRRD